MSEMLCIEAANGAVIHFKRDKVWVVIWQPNTYILQVWMEGQELPHELQTSEAGAENFMVKFYAPK